MRDIKGISRKSIFLMIASLIMLFSCTDTTVDYNSYLKYLANSENGLTREHVTHGIKLKVKYLPIDYLVYNAVKSIDSTISDKEVEKIKKEYANSLTFVFTLGPADNESFSITTIGVENYQQFAERIETMSFNMKECITLEVNEKQYEPELIQMETINTNEPSKNLIIVFKTTDEQGKNIMNSDMTFTYNDELFYTGISKFVFKTNDIKALPQLDFRLLKTGK